MTTDVELLPLPEPYGYLRDLDGGLQMSIGPVRPADRAGGYATPWAAMYDTGRVRANVEHHTAAKDAEIEALRAEVEKAERSVEHTHQWYAVRLEKIKEVAKRVGLWSEVAAIIANGSSSIYDPPTYAQQLNIAKHAAKAAEARAERLAEALRFIAEGNLGSLPWQAGFSRIREHARAALRDHDQEVGNG